MTDDLQNQIDETIDETPSLTMEDLLADERFAPVLADPVALQESLSKAQDYTTKTQQLADERRAHEEELRLANEWKELRGIFEDPTTRREFAQRLLEDDGSQSADGNYAGEVDTSLFTDNEMALYKMLQAERASTRKVLEQVQPFIEKTVIADKVREAAGRAESEYGVKITPEDLQNAMTTLRTDNPLFAAAHLAAKQPKAAPAAKPNTPAVQGQRVNALEETQGGTALFNMLSGNPNRATGK